MKSNFDKWFVTNADEYDNYIRYSDISAFQYDKQNQSIRIFLRGSSAPMVLGFGNLDALKMALDTMKKNLSPQTTN